ncbi:SDR family oxidoreductase [Serratia proteamaculans]|uniref:SDR family oxidoreductase n=1 Tax=Serratia proteamaculans TaxID=28151 RepID=UPI0021770B0E|nr:SDR family oxidoreductase [Serratia proteamaculans]CAI1533338.1 3-oxoacyl-[acyl-carrier-protein] reductase FabG [Serratia proteamaculans]CAI1621565.1 3-oxoacyl-[acyl-carrier-protein] reductase FabG [Serratia proteamaculans]CAI2426041.1 3-oxoacyl-[acyl-carrier-protein] reductase FabG [Serratia proteamaculans]
MTTTVLITGANKGLGYETARRLAERGWRVVLGARDPLRGEQAIQALALLGLKAELLVLDVTSEESVRQAAADFSKAYGQLDVLINNAGVGGSREHPAQTGAAALAEMYQANVFGVVRMMQAFLPLLQAAKNPRVVMVSSSLGSSHTMTGKGGATFEAGLLQLAYPSSKAALNMLVTQYAKALPTIRINAVNPGFTKTDINHHTGHQTVTEGTDAIVTLASIGNDGPTGGFFDRHGEIPW